MKINYHTHTSRCGHARGEDREYVEAALEKGLSVLGFSDHSPHWNNKPIPMKGRVAPEEFSSYCNAVRALREEYQGRLEIRLGVEIEYFPEHFTFDQKVLKENGVEYAILGQHYLGNGEEDGNCFKKTDDAPTLRKYCHQVAEGIRTRFFTYVAHPDVFHFVGDPQIYQEAMREICLASKETNIPLEINFLGIREGRNYPNPLFWEVAGEVGCPVVFGCDAHDPPLVYDQEREKIALEWVERYGLSYLSEPTLILI